MSRSQFAQITSSSMYIVEVCDVRKIAKEGKNRIYPHNISKLLKSK
ncbi:hypothetical protein [Nostoc sp.]